MKIELDNEEARLLHIVILEKAQEHFSYSNTSEIAGRLCKLAAKLRRTSQDLEVVKSNPSKLQGFRSTRNDNCGGVVRVGAEVLEELAVDAR